MALTAGVISLLSTTATTASLSATAATLGTGPYTYQWYRDTVSGFTPGVGNLVAGATALTLNDSGLIPNTAYYYKVVATDSVAATVEYAQVLASTSAPVLNPNQFAQSPYLGMIDLRFPYNSASVQIGADQATPLFAGAAVKMVDSAGGVPKVVGCAADSDEVLGFINFDIKTVSFAANVGAEISMAGNVMYLYATAPVARGEELVLDTATNGGVQSSGVGSGKTIVGWAYDKATAPGQLIRVFLKTPSFTLSV